MKHPVKLLILFILSGTTAIINLFNSYRSFPTLETDVSNARMKFLKDMPDWLDLESIPEFIALNINEAFIHFETMGVTHFHVEVWSHVLGLLGVLLMAASKKIGFWSYVSGQVLGFSAIFIGFGVNTTMLIAAFIYGLLSMVFIMLYRKWFLLKL